MCDLLALNEPNHLFEYIFFTKYWLKNSKLVAFGNNVQYVVCTATLG